MKAKLKVRNHPADIEMYKETTWEENKVKANRDEKRKKLRPTSIALNEDTVAQLKRIAEERGIPYQVLMRSYILKGIKDDLAS